MKNSLKRKISVMLIADRLEPGGAEMVIYNLLMGLDREKFKPYLCCLSRTGKLGESLKKQGVDVFCLDSKQGMDILLPLRLAYIFNRLKIQIVHVHTSTAYKHAVVASLLSRTKIVIQTRHGDELNKRAIHNTRLYRYLIGRANKIVCICDNLKIKIQQQNKFLAAKLSVIHNGIDVEKIVKSDMDPQAKRKELGIGADDHLILNVANIRPEKGQEMLIWAFYSITSQFPKAKLVIVGGDSNIAIAKKLKNLVQSLAISEKVVFLGQSSEVPEILNCADMFVLPSLTEGLPISLLEAMAAGKPVIATEVGGIPEIVTHNENGILIKADSTQELAAAITMLINDKNLSRFLGENARQSVISKFSSQAMARQYENLYLELTGNARTRKTTLLVVGPKPPPIGGISVYVQEQFHSSLNRQYRMLHFNTAKKSGIGIFRQLYLITKFTVTLIIKNPKIVHIHTCSYLTFWRNVLDVIIVKFVFGKKLILQVHGGRFNQFYFSSGNLKKHIIRKTLRSADQVVALSEYWKTFFRDTVGLENAVTIFNGIPTEDYQNHYAARWNGAGKNNNNILFLGEIRQEKGVSDIEKAIPLIRDKVNSFTFTLAGKNVNQVRKGSQNGHLQYTGEIYGSQKFRCFQDADIFVLPSYAENLPLVILEAMASGLPVVATDVGGIPEIIKDGENGFLIKPGDIRALADKIIYLMEHPELRKEMGKRNRELAIEKYDFSRVAQELDQLYLSLIN